MPLDILVLHERGGGHDLPAARDRGAPTGRLARARRRTHAADRRRLAAPLHQAVRALHIGQRPHRPRPQLLDRRRVRALPTRAREQGAVRVRLRRVRAAGRARRRRPRDPSERVGRALRRAHDRPAAAARLLVRLGADVHELGPDHVSLVAVAVPAAARGRPRLPRDRQRRLVRHVPDDARDDPGRGRAVLALSQPRSPDRAPDVVPARQRLHSRERPSADRAGGERQMGRGRPGQPALRARARRRRRGRSQRRGRRAPDRVHAARRRARPGALRADLPQAPRDRRVGVRSGRPRAPRRAALRRPGAQLARRARPAVDRRCPC